MELANKRQLNWQDSFDFTNGKQTLNRRAMSPLLNSHSFWDNKGIKEKQTQLKHWIFFEF